MQDYIVLRVIVKFVTPFILIYGFYIQLHGKYSPGGGFQAGVIVSAALILNSMLIGSKSINKFINIEELKVLSCLGVLIYTFVGLWGIFLGGNYLDYSVLNSDVILGQKIGITIIEICVGITVFAVMMMLFLLFANRHDGHEGSDGQTCDVHPSAVITKVEKPTVKKDEIKSETKVKPKLNSKAAKSTKAKTKDKKATAKRTKKTNNSKSKKVGDKK